PGEGVVGLEVHRVLSRAVGENPLGDGPRRRGAQVDAVVSEEERGILAGVIDPRQAVSDVGELEVDGRGVADFVGQPSRPPGVYPVGEEAGLALGVEEVRDGPGRAGAPALFKSFEPWLKTVKGKMLHWSFLSGKQFFGQPIVHASPSSLLGPPG